MTIELTTSDLRAESLRDLRDAEVQLPGDPGYDAARMPWNVAVDQRPAAVATPEFRAMRGWHQFAPQVRSRTQVIVPV